MADPLDQAIRERIIELRREGHSFSSIATLTGISKSTIHTILKREGLNAPNTPTAHARTVESCPHIREDYEDLDDVGLGPNPSTEQAPETDPFAELTRANTAAGLNRYLKMTLEGAQKARKAKEKAAKEKDPDAERRRSQKAWEEVQYLKLYRDGLKIAAECTGLSKEVTDIPALDPVSDYLERSLAALSESIDKQSEGGSA